MIQNEHERRKENDGRQHLESKEVMCVLLSEHEARPGVDKPQEGFEKISRRLKYGGPDRRFENEKGQPELQQKAAQYNAQVYRLLALADQPCQRHEDDKAQKTDQALHGVSTANVPAMSRRDSKTKRADALLRRERFPLKASAA